MMEEIHIFKLCRKEYPRGYRGLRFKLFKMQITCFLRKRQRPKVKLNIYNQLLEQVYVVKLWMDSKLTFGIHIQQNI